MKTVAFLPMKLNSERLAGKNIRVLGSKPLYKHILDRLIDVHDIDQIYIFCSTNSFSNLPSSVKFLRRSEHLDEDSASIIDVAQSFAKHVKADVYLMAHATSPFLSSGSIREVLNSVINGGHDSAFTAERLSKFLWTTQGPLNHKTSQVPRTQDLDPLYAETSGAYAFTYDVINGRRRTGDSPRILEVSKLEAHDIDDEEDWEMAEAIWRYLDGSS